jgi:hypothetical protein
MPNIISLNGVEFTDESREPLQTQRDERMVEVELANGSKRRYIKGLYKKWTIQWTNVSADATYTIDGFGGRNQISSVALDSYGSMDLRVKDGLHDNTYTVFVESYEEELLQRRSTEEGFRYRISLTLVQAV